MKNFSKDVEVILELLKCDNIDNSVNLADNFNLYR